MKKIRGALTVTFYLKSGHTITVQADRIKTTSSTQTGDIAGYEITWPEGYRGPKLLDVSIDQLAAVTTEQN